MLLHAADFGQFAAQSGTINLSPIGSSTLGVRPLALLSRFVSQGDLFTVYIRAGLKVGDYDI